MTSALAPAALLARLRARWRRRGLAARIGLAMATALVAMQLLAGLGFFLMPPPTFTVFGTRWLVETSVDLYGRAVAGASETELARLPAAQQLRVEIVDRLPLPPPGPPAMSFWPFQRLGPTLAAALGGKVPVVTMEMGPPPMSGRDGIVAVPADIGEGLPRGPLRPEEPDIVIPQGFGFAVGLPDGRALLIGSRDMGPNPRPRLLFLLLGGALLITVVAVWTARSLVTPLEELAVVADRLGRERGAVDLPELAVPELEAIARAFRTMHARLTRFVDERTRILASISHDLRTPLTRLMLSAEYVSDPRQRADLVASLQDMKIMLEETLAFAGQDAKTEETRLVDLAAMTASLCDEAADTGADITCEGLLHANAACRPVAMRRALGNVIRNAVAYAGGGRVSVTREGGELVVVVADDGPGVPEDVDLDALFQPFRRGEGSRNRETGGTGLGLTIARDVIVGHGGTIGLARGGVGRPGRGLVVTVRLPAA